MDHFIEKGNIRRSNVWGKVMAVFGYVPFEMIWGTKVEMSIMQLEIRFGAQKKDGGLMILAWETLVKLEFLYE